MARTSLGTALLLSALVAGCSSAGPEAGGGSVPDASASDADAGAVSGDDASSEVATRDSGAPTTDSSLDSAKPVEGGDANGDSGSDCEVYGAPGQCIDVTACMGLGDHTSYAGHCPGPATIECCIDTPDTADNPPVPAGWVLMQQSQVTTAMTNWAVMILDDYAGYPMFSETFMTFGTQLVMARVEWHPPDFQNNIVHRGVTLYEPTD